MAKKKAAKRVKTYHSDLPGKVTIPGAERTIKRDKWVTAKVKVTKAGKVLAKVPASAVKKATKKVAKRKKP